MMNTELLFQKFPMTVQVVQMDNTVQQRMLYALLTNVLVIVQQDSTKAVRMLVFLVS